MVSGNADLGSSFLLLLLSRDSAQLFEPEAVVKMQGEGTIRWAYSWKLQLPQKIKGGGAFRGGEEREAEL